MHGSHKTPEDAEKLFRSSESTQTPEQLRVIFNGYVTAGKQYNAYALALDFYEMAKPLLDELSKNYEHDFLYTVFVLFCCEQYKDRAISLALMLVDEYEQTQENEKIMNMYILLVETFDSPRNSTPGIVIMKAAINAAINIVEGVKNELPSDELATLICKTLSYLPSFFYDAEFMLTSLNRIANCYSNDYDPQLVLIAVFLPSVRDGFDTLQKHFEAHIGVGGLDDESLRGLISVCYDYKDILFGVDYPVLDEGEPYRISADTTDIDNHLAMIREEQDLAHELLNLTNEDKNRIPELRERYERVIEYFTNFNNPALQYTDMEIISHIAFSAAAWRKIDLLYALEEIMPYMERLLTFVPNESISTGVIYTIQTNLTYISEIYAQSKDAAKEYECHLQFLRLGNAYLKRICFENGIDYFLENTKQEYLYYHYVLYSAAQIAQEHGFAVDELYFELCKRKNIFYLGEMWQKQGSSASAIHNLLRKDFTFADLQAAIPADSMLIDFFYVRAHYENIGTDESTIDSRINSTCIAFTLAAKREVKIHFVSDGVKLVENMRSEDEYVPYFKWITKRLLDDAHDINRLFVCTEGDLNQLSFAALPHLDGYVTDRYAVRNIASAFDVVYPHKKKNIKTALVVSAPDYGESKEQPPKWKPLLMSRKESEFIIDALYYDHSVDVDLVYGQDATVENVTAGLVSQSYNAVHISTHGYFKDGNVYMVMAGANCDDNDTAVISDSDFGAFSLENTPLVTLALCFGARQSLLLQDSLSGFIKVSLLAGANTIIAPTLPIPDLATAVFMSEFYSRYLSALDAENAEIAMQKTIAAIRNMSKAELFDKYYIDVEEEYPFAEAHHWGSWVCFSAEETR
jgi:CHAT domain-containing protein